jgi:uncharacterized protein
MHIYFNDTSALVKLYVPEIGSSWITSEYRRPDVLMVVGDITTVEVPAAFGRAEREGRLSATQRQQALARFDADCAQAFMIETITAPVFALARDLIERHPLKAYDAVQLALALKLHPSVVSLGGVSFTFVSADDGLNRGAMAEGLLVDNPNLNP